MKVLLEGTASAIKVIRDASSIFSMLEGQFMR